MVLSYMYSLCELDQNDSSILRWFEGFRLWLDERERELCVCVCVCVSLCFCKVCIGHGSSPDEDVSYESSGVTPVCGLASVGAARSWIKV